MIMAIVVLLSTICFGQALSFYYRPNLPTTPQPQIGRIYPLNNHGWITYLTKEEWYLYNFLYAMAAFYLILFALIGWFIDPFNCFSKHEKT